MHGFANLTPGIPRAPFSTRIAFMASRRLELVPRGAQNAMEVVLEQVQGMIMKEMGIEKLSQRRPKSTAQ